jgi:alkylation response protein AidB-like acyl-CoA dehydrogenase
MKLSESQVLLEAAAQRYLSAATPGPTAEAMRKRWIEFGEFGWLGGVVAEEMGGYGGPVELAVLSRQIGATLAPEPWIEGAVVPITFFASIDGTAAQRELSAATMAGTTTIVGAPFMLTDQFPPPTPQLTRCGNRLELSGQMSELVPIDIAHMVLVPANSESGPVILVVDLSTPGIERVTTGTVDGRAVSRLRFNRASLPGDAVLGSVAELLPALGLASDMAILAQVAEMVGVLEAMHTMTQEYLQVRSQFGQRLSSFQVLRHRLADMFAELEQARAMLSVGVTAFSDVDHATRNGLISACKLRLCKASRFIGAQAIQLHGAIALTQEYRVGAYYKRLLVLERTAGDAYFHAMNFYRQSRRARKPDDVLSPVRQPAGTCPSSPA